MKRGKRLALSALCGIAAAAVVLTAIGGVRAEAARAEQEALERYGGDLTAVCVATRTIGPSEEIDEGNVEVVEWVSSMLPTDAITSLQDAAGKVTTSRIPQGAPLSSAYFERTDSAVEVPHGKVAVSIASDAEHAVGGALARGDLVDVYVSKDGVADRLVSAEVLDTSALADGGGKMSWVTLAVEPSAMRELLAATALGTVWLAIPGADVGTVEANDADIGVSAGESDIAAMQDGDANAADEVTEGEGQ